MTRTSLLERGSVHASPGDLPLISPQPDLRRAGEQIADWTRAANANADYELDRQPKPVLLTAGSGYIPPADVKTALASDEQPEHDRAPLTEDESTALKGIEKGLMEHNPDHAVETKND